MVEILHAAFLLLSATNTTRINGEELKQVLTEQYDMNIGCTTASTAKGRGLI